jgi:hypothetical protein
VTGGNSEPRFVAEWNTAFALVAGAGVVLLALGHVAAGVAALVLCGAAVVLRAQAMRRQRRGFYGRGWQGRRGR